MAYLSERRGERGQLIIVTAFALGVLFVALALILNSAIFTENLASRGETTGNDKVVEYRDGLERGAGDLLTFENENVTTGGPSHADVLNNVKNGTTRIDTVLDRRSEKTGGTSTATWNTTDVTNGTLIRQTDESRNFSDGGSPINESWTVAEDVDQTRAFQFNATSASSTCTLLTTCFTLNVNNGSDSWKLSIQDPPSGEYEIEIDNGSGAVESCGPVSNPFVVVDITAGTFGGEDCAALDFTEAPNSDYDIEIQHGNAVNGTYSLVVDNDSLATSVPGYYTTDVDSGEPAVTPALYDITIDYEYRTADIKYNSSVRVAPGEPDA